MRKEIIRQYIKHKHHHLGFVANDFTKIKNFSLIKESFYSSKNEYRNYKMYLSKENIIYDDIEEVDHMWQNFLKEHQDTLKKISHDQAFKRPFNQKLIDAIILIFKRDNK
jgi:hypothetical protein